MCALQTGPAPVRNYRAFIARAAVAALMAAMGGCASNSSQTTGHAQSAMHVAQAVVDLEDDGLPAQTPPPFAIRKAPDDPNEPYSPNYGGGNPSASAAPNDMEYRPHHVPEPRVPNDLPPAFRQKLVAALAGQD
jgi:hypothetical protein